MDTSDVRFDIEYDERVANDAGARAALAARGAFRAQPQNILCVGFPMRHQDGGSGTRVISAEFVTSLCSVRLSYRRVLWL